jgi:hypothetical protein
MIAWWARWSMAQASFGLPVRAARQDTNASNRSPANPSRCKDIASVTSPYRTVTSVRQTPTGIVGLGAHQTDNLMSDCQQLRQSPALCCRLRHGETSAAVSESDRTRQA